MKHRQFGFTLIEIMITVAIVGLIASLAYPSYMTSVRKGNRAEAKTELVDVAQRLQRCYTTYARFNEDKCSVYKQLNEGEKKITTRGAGFYEIRLVDDGVDENDNTTYLLEAKPVTGKTQTEDYDCQSFRLTHSGVQSSLNKLDTDSTDKCW